MGQENSLIDPDEPTVTLSERSLEAVAEYIKDAAMRIVVMTGAGLSTSAGIPDFRSPGTGLYSNLARLNLPHPEAVFELSYFREHPEPFYVLAKELYPGKFYPTVSHAFIALLNEKNLLHMLFTQNIDCLERQAGVPGDKIVEAHGSFATQRCIDCKTEYPDKLIKEAVESAQVPHCIVPQCNGLVKPDIVFFGESLPESFFNNIGAPAEADLIIVLGTSLTVMPFASLPSRAREGVPRLLFNMDRVGDMGSRSDDVVILGDCDSSVRQLADLLGWRDELEALYLKVGGKAKETEAAKLREARLAGMSKDEILEEEIARITGEVEASLKLTEEHKERVNSQLDREASKEKEKEETQLVNTETAKETAPTLESEQKLATAEKVSTEESAQSPQASTDAIVDGTQPQDKLGVTTGSTKPHM